MHFFILFLFKLIRIQVSQVKSDIIDHGVVLSTPWKVLYVLLAVSLLVAIVDHVSLILLIIQDYSNHYTSICVSVCLYVIYNTIVRDVLGTWITSYCVYLQIPFLFFIIIGDTTPPSMRGVCPGDIIAFADKFQVNTKVTWRENKAFDETDGYVE